MMFFVFWVILLLAVIVSVPVAAWLDKRKLEAAYSGMDSDESFEVESFEDAEAAEGGDVMESSGTFETVSDGEETRGWDLLEGLSGDDGIAQHPDLDLAYLQAAYQGGPADHASASEGLLQNGVHGAVRKSWLLGRLSSYHLANSDPQQAFEYGVKSLISTHDVSAPDVAATINLLQPVFEATKHPDLAAKLQSLQTAPDEDADAKKVIKKAVKKLSARKSKATVAEAAELLRSTDL
ncbi:MAG: hypothetical protein ACR2NZ_20530 [Rubripirellula sp.]